MASPQATDLPRASALRGELELLAPGDAGALVMVHTAGALAGELRVGRSLDTDKRAQLIAEIRGGKHVELELDAVTFKQRDGSPNRNYLRFRTDKLEAIAASFAGMPMLIDHNRWEQSARVGTVVASEAVELAYGWSGFRQTLRVVKPHAAISVLDGTLDRFSIGWSTTGPVLCSVHRTDKLARGRCSCWPGDKVDVDGKAQIVEYEWQSAEGTETSGVNVPAVKGTKIEDVRAALAAELNLNLEHREKPTMSFPRLAAVLGLAALSEDRDEAAGVTAAEALKRELAASRQEVATQLAANAEIAGQLAKRDARIAALEEATIDTALAAVVPDSHGLTALPFLAGERSPGWRGDARAAVAGTSPAAESRNTCPTRIRLGLSSAFHAASSR